MRKKVDFNVVREIAKALPDVEESTIHGAPSLKVRGRLLACPALHKSAEPNSLVVRIAFEQRAQFLASEPSVYYLTAHYVNYPAMLVRLPQISLGSLREVLDKAWHYASETARKSGRRPYQKRAPSFRRKPG